MPEEKDDTLEGTQIPPEAETDPAVAQLFQEDDEPDIPYDEVTASRDVTEEYMAEVQSLIERSLKPIRQSAHNLEVEFKETFLGQIYPQIRGAIEELDTEIDRLDQRIDHIRHQMMVEFWFRNPGAILFFVMTLVFIVSVAEFAISNNPIIGNVLAFSFTAIMVFLLISAFILGTLAILYVANYILSRHARFYGQPPSPTKKKLPVKKVRKHQKEDEKQPEEDGDGGDEE